MTLASEVDKEIAKGIYCAMALYRDRVSTEVDHAETQLDKLPEHQKNKVKNYKNKFLSIRYCISLNQSFLNIVRTGMCDLFGNNSIDFLNEETVEQAEQICPVFLDVDRINSILGQLFREWSEAGSGERDISFRPMIDEINEIFPSDLSKREDITILVPGSGVGRLPYELFKLGYSCVGNDFSMDFLFFADFMLNRCCGMNNFTIFPWVGVFNNSPNLEAQLLAVRIPDVDTSELRKHPKGANKLYVQAGDFLEVQKKDNVYDCVATCFFIDCTPNIIHTVEKIHQILKPGGYWVNFGPLMYHYSVQDDVGAIALSLDDVTTVINNSGLTITKPIRNMKTTYCHNPYSMVSTVYECVLIVARKPEAPGTASATASATTS